MNSYRFHQTTIYKRQNKSVDYWFYVNFAEQVNSSLDAIKRHLGIVLFNNSKILAQNKVNSDSDLFNITVEVKSFEKIVKCSYCGNKQKTTISEPLNYLIHTSRCQVCRKENWINTITWRIEN
jgi:hypothetical protein